MMLLWQPHGPPWWPWALLALAAYLIVSFGVGFPIDDQNAQNALSDLQETDGLGPGVVPDPRDYSLRNGKASALAWEVYVPAAQHRNRDVTATAIGILAALLGVGRLTRGQDMPAIASVPSAKGRTDDP